MLKVKSVECKNRSWIRRKFIHNDCFETLHDYHFTYYVNGIRCTTLIPKGYHFDGASVPKKAQKKLDFYSNGEHIDWTVIHDFIYENKGRLKTIDGGNVKVSRKFSDDLYRNQLLAYTNYNRNTIEIIHKTIRKFGKLFWFDNPIRDIFR